jgi:hypothetical protein
MKQKYHESGLVNRLVQLHENGTKMLGRVSLLTLEHWKKSESLREELKEEKAKVETLTMALRHNTKY